MTTHTLAPSESTRLVGASSGIGRGFLLGETMKTTTATFDGLATVWKQQDGGDWGRVRAGKTRSAVRAILDDLPSGTLVRVEIRGRTILKPHRIYDPVSGRNMFFLPVS